MADADAAGGTGESPARPPTMAEVKIKAVVDALDRHGGCKVAAAAELEVSLRTVYNLLRKGAAEFVAGTAQPNRQGGRGAKGDRNAGGRSPEWAEGFPDRLAEYADLLADRRA